MRDVAAIAGLVCLTAGCWMVSPALALIVVGTVLLGGAVWGHLTGGGS